MAALLQHSRFQHRHAHSTATSSRQPTLAGSRRSHRACRARRCLANASIEDDLREVSEILEDKRAEMQSAAGNEDYEAAIVARDACHQLELQQRSLQLSLDSHLRSTVLHSLGTVIVHRKYEYRGVITGIDPVCAAGDNWCKMMGVDRLRLGRQQPFFHCLVDERDRPGAVTTYVAQENIVRARTVDPIQHPLVAKLFTEFRHGAYVPTAELAAASRHNPDPDPAAEDS